MQQTAKHVIDFWTEAGPELWFRGGEAFDQRCRARASLDDPCVPQPFVEALTLHAIF